MSLSPVHFIIRRTRNNRFAIVERGRYIARNDAIRYESKDPKRVAKVLDWLNDIFANC